MNDPSITTAIIVAVLARVFVGLCNVHFGPLPGAEVDAVLYDGYARTVATDAARGVAFAREWGRLGYSTLLAIPYAFGGYHPMLPTFVNALFVIESMAIGAGLSHAAGGATAARWFSWVAALYPTGILYTAVPLREAQLLAGLALFVLGLHAFVFQESNLGLGAGLLGLGFAVWLNDGFALALILLPVAFWFRLSHWSVSVRLTWFALAAGAAVLLLTSVASLFGKLPNDLTLLLEPEFLARMRGIKAAYGVGYGTFDGTWSGVVTTVPEIYVGFLGAPFPVWFRGAGDLVKGAEGMAVLAGTTLATVIVVTERKSNQPEARRRRLMFLMFAALVAIFGFGTANTGIAVRHRAKLVWMVVVVVASWAAQRRRRRS